MEVKGISGKNREQIRVRGIQRKRERERKCGQVEGKKDESKRGQAVINQFQRLPARQAVFSRAGSRENAHRGACCRCGIRNVTRAPGRSSRSAVRGFHSIGVVCLFACRSCLLYKVFSCYLHRHRSLDSYHSTSDGKYSQTRKNAPNRHGKTFLHCFIHSFNFCNQMFLSCDQDMKRTSVHHWALCSHMFTPGAKLAKYPICLLTLIGELGGNQRTKRKPTDTLETPRRLKPESRVEP